MPFWGWGNVYVEYCKHVGTGLEMREEYQITGSCRFSSLESTSERVTSRFWRGDRQESG